MGLESRCDSDNTGGGHSAGVVVSPTAEVMTAGGQKPEEKAGYMQINRCIFETLISQQELDRVQVRAGLQHVRRKAVPQGVRSDPLREPGS